MQIKYYKYQSSGNSFVLIDNLNVKPLSNQVISKIISTNEVRDSDGLLLLYPSEKFDFKLIFFNPDGSKSFCGNGSICSVHYLKSKKLIKNQCSFQSYGKKYNAIIDPEIKIKMVDISKIKKINNGYFVNSGAPHYVEFVDDLNKVDIIQEVTKIKSSEFYDNLPFNINFIQKENNLIYIRTFEKGVERETLSCGTGAVASSVVCSKIFEGNFPLIKARGGDLRVNYKKKRDLFYDITLSSNPLMEYNSYLKIISS